MREAFPDMIFDGELYRDDVNKISYVLGSYQDFLDARGRFPDLESGTRGGRGGRRCSAISESRVSPRPMRLTGCSRISARIGRTSRWWPASSPEMWRGTGSPALSNGSA